MVKYKLNQKHLKFAVSSFVSVFNLIFFGGGSRWEVAKVLFLDIPVMLTFFLGGQYWNLNSGPHTW
jgi:hypothetical protein